MSKESFLTKERLKKNEAIKAVLDKGICLRSKSLNIYILKKQDKSVNKAAFICKKALHQKKAVLRNRIKRILKEAYRKTKYIFPAEHDIVIIGTRVFYDTVSTDIENEIRDVVSKYNKK